MSSFILRDWTSGEVVTESIADQQWNVNQGLLAKRAISFTFGDRAGPVLTTGVQGFLYVPHAYTITGWSLVGDAASGSIVLDVWRATYPTVPTVANTIAGSEKPTISAAQVGQDLTLTTWTTALVAGSHLGLNIDSVSTFKQVSLTLLLTTA